MWHIIPAILYLTYVQGLLQPPRLNNQYSIYGNNERNVASNYYVPPGQASLKPSNNVPVKPYPENPVILPLNYYYQPYPQRPAQYNDDPYYNVNLTYVQGLLQPPRLNNQYSIYGNNERNVASNYYVPPGQASLKPSYNVPVKPYPENPVTLPLNYYYQPYPQRPVQYNDDPYYNVKQPYNTLFSGNPDIISGYLRQSPPQKPNLLTEAYPFNLDYGTDSEMDEPKSVSDVQSYFDDLDLIDNFGNYLKRRTLLDGSSTAVSDAAYQYNALLAVIIALARTVRSSCTDFDQIYDKVYQSSVDTYYKYGLDNAEKVSGMIEDYIRKGNSHMPRLRKLKQVLCEQNLFCSGTFDNKIKSAPLMYVKELETLEALSNLARSFYPYIEEFNQAAQKSAVLPYLQNSKDRLREYVMHVVNSVEHLTDKLVICR